MEYFAGETDSSDDNVSGPYREDLDFAFFVVNFGYSRADYDALTRRQKAFIYKAWENRLISENTLLYNAMFAATYNVNRPKRKPPLKLWKKSGMRTADPEVVQENMQIVREVEQKEGNAWIQKIHAAAGIQGGEKNGR